MNKILKYFLQYKATKNYFIWFSLLYTMWLARLSVQVNALSAIIKWKPLSSTCQGSVYYDTQGELKY